MTSACAFCGPASAAGIVAMTPGGPVCRAHALEYYQGLVFCAVHPSRAVNERRVLCRDCGQLFTYVAAPGARTKKTICGPCYRLIRSRIALKSWETRPPTAPRRVTTGLAMADLIQGVRDATVVCDFVDRCAERVPDGLGATGRLCDS